MSQLVTSGGNHAVAPATQQETGQARGQGTEHRVEPRDREGYASDTRSTSSQDTSQASARDDRRDSDATGDHRLPTDTTEQDAGTGQVDRVSPEPDKPAADRPDIASRYPADYTPVSAPLLPVEGVHEQPETWVDSINPEKMAPGRDNNCGECSRAVDRTWNGDVHAAAAMSDANAPGEPTARMTEWAGQAPAQASMSGIGHRLQNLGPGSSAVVGCDWKYGGGHWFNAVNDGGTVKAVDGQSGSVEPWPPSAQGLGFDESDMRYSDAIFFTVDGKVDGK